MPNCQIHTNGYNRGKFWRGRTVQIIILIECRCHSAVWEKAGTKESMECLEVGGRVGLERKGRDVKVFVRINLPEASGNLL